MPIKYSIENTSTDLHKNIKLGEPSDGSFPNIQSQSEDKKKFLHRSPVERISQRIKRNGTFSHTCVVGSMISSQKPYFVTVFVRLITSERQWELEE